MKVILQGKNYGAKIVITDVKRVVVDDLFIKVVPYDDEEESVCCGRGIYEIIDIKDERGE